MSLNTQQSAHLYPQYPWQLSRLLTCIPQYRWQLSRLLTCIPQYPWQLSRLLTCIPQYPWQLGRLLTCIPDIVDNSAGCSPSPQYPPATQMHSQWASYQIREIAVAHAPEWFPSHRLQRKPLVSDPGMYNSTSLRHVRYARAVPWCMSGSLTRGGGENVPAFPAHAQPTILRIWQGAHTSTPGGGYSAWKLMGVCRWPLKIGPKKIEEKIEFGAKKIDFCKNW